MKEIEDVQYLVGQIYCDLYLSSKQREITREKFLDESLFCNMLNRDLAKAYKRLNKPYRVMIQHVVGSMEPFCVSDQCIHEDPRKLMAICEKYDPRKIMGHLRYKYNANAYLRALNENKIDRNDGLSSELDDFVSGIILLVEDDKGKKITTIDGVKDWVVDATRVALKINTVYVPYLGASGSMDASLTKYWTGYFQDKQREKENKVSQIEAQKLQLRHEKNMKRNQIQLKIANAQSELQSLVAAQQEGEKGIDSTLQVEIERIMADIRGEKAKLEGLGKGQKYFASLYGFLQIADHLNAGEFLPSLRGMVTEYENKITSFVLQYFAPAWRLVEDRIIVLLGMDGMLTDYTFRKRTEWSEINVLIPSLDLGKEISAVSSQKPEKVIAFPPKVQAFITAFSVSSDLTSAGLNLALDDPRCSFSSAPKVSEIGDQVEILLAKYDEKNVSPVHLRLSILGHLSVTTTEKVPGSKRYVMIGWLKANATEQGITGNRFALGWKISLMDNSPVVAAGYRKTRASRGLDSVIAQLNPELRGATSVSVTSISPHEQAIKYSFLFPAKFVEDPSIMLESRNARQIPLAEGFFGNMWQKIMSIFVSKSQLETEKIFLKMAEEAQKKIYDFFKTHLSALYQTTYENAPEYIKSHFSTSRAGAMYVYAQIYLIQKEYGEGFLSEWIKIFDKYASKDLMSEYIPVKSSVEKMMNQRNAPSSSLLFQRLQQEKAVLKHMSKVGAGYDIAALVKAKKKFIATLTPAPVSGMTVHDRHVKANREFAAAIKKIKTKEEGEALYAKFLKDVPPVNTPRHTWIHRILRGMARYILHDSARDTEAEQLYGYAVNDKEFSVVVSIPKDYEVLEYPLGPHARPNIEADLAKLRTTGYKEKLQMGWKLEYIWFFPHSSALASNTESFNGGVFLTKRVFMSPEKAGTSPAQKAEYYQIPLSDLYQLRGEKIEDVITNVAATIGTDYDEVFQNMGQLRLAASYSGDGANLMEDKDAPTDYVTDRKTLGEKGAPGQIVLPDGVELNKEQVKYILSKALGNLADQIGSASLKSDSDDEIPAEAGDDLDSDEADDDSSDDEISAEADGDDEIPAEADDDSDSDEADDDSSDDEISAEADDDDEIPAEADDDSDSDEADDDSSDDDSDKKKIKKIKNGKKDKKKKADEVKKKVQEHRLRRMFALKRSLPLFESCSRRLSGRQKSALLNLRSGIKASSACEVIKHIRSLPIHPFVSRILESYSTCHALSLGNYRRAFRDAFTLAGSNSYHGDEIAVALAQAKNKVGFKALLEDQDVLAISQLPYAADNDYVGVSTALPDDVALATSIDAILKGEKLASKQVEDPDFMPDEKEVSAYLQDQPNDLEPELDKADSGIYSPSDMAVADIVVPYDSLENDIEPVAEYDPSDDFPENHDEDDDFAYKMANELPVVDIDDEKADMPYEAYLRKQDRVLSEVVNHRGSFSIPTKSLRLLPSGSGLNLMLNEVNSGNVNRLAKRRLYSRVNSIALSLCPHEIMMESHHYLLVYLTGAGDKLLERYSGFVNGNIGVLPIGKLALAEKKKVMSDCQQFGYVLPVRKSIHHKDFSSLCEGLEVPEGLEADEAATTFLDAIGVLGIARKALVDFEGQIGKIKTLISLEDGGRRTLKSLKKIANDIKGMLASLKENMKEFSKSYDVFQNEFPEASPTKDAEEEPEEEQELDDVEDVEVDSDLEGEDANVVEAVRSIRAKCDVDSLTKNHRQVFLNQHVLSECKRLNADIDRVYALLEKR